MHKLLIAALTICVLQAASLANAESFLSTTNVMEFNQMCSVQGWVELDRRYDFSGNLWIGNEEIQEVLFYKDQKVCGLPLKSHKEFEVAAQKLTQIMLEDFLYALPQDISLIISDILYLHFIQNRDWEAKKLKIPR